MKIDWKSFAIGAVAVLAAQYVRSQMSSTTASTPMQLGPGPVQLATS